MELIIWLSLAIVFILLLFSALLSGAETALTGASRAHIHQLARAGNRRAVLVNRLYQRKEHMISALLLGNNAVNTLAVALMTHFMIYFFDDSGVIYATILMTFLIVIFAEVLPKIYAISNADRNALRIVPLIRMLIVVLKPLTAMVQKIVSFLLKTLGLTVDEKSLISTSEIELRGAIDLHRGDKSEDDDESREERAMLQSILDLANVMVSDVMTHRRHVVMIDEDLSVAEIINTVLNSPFTRLPVWRGETDNIIGVVHTHTLVREILSHGSQVDHIDILAIMSQPWFIPDTTTLFDQLQTFRQRHEHFALVVDEYGSLMGVVTLEDILEEIVGDIIDEKDLTVPEIRPQADGSYVMHGSVTLRDVNREFDWNLPDDKASTIAGMILNETRRIPQIGQVFTLYDFRFEILSSQRHQITSVRITPPAQNSTSTKDKD